MPPKGDKVLFQKLHGISLKFCQHVFPSFQSCSRIFVPPSPALFCVVGLLPVGLLFLVGPEQKGGQHVSCSAAQDLRLGVFICLYLSTPLAKKIDCVRLCCFEDFMYTVTSRNMVAHANKE